MNKSWLRLPIYLNGELRFEANPSGDLTVVDAYERMDFVFENIEFCFAEGRMMDVEIFDRLDMLGDRVRENNYPPFAELTNLIVSISSRYGFDEPPNSDSKWIRRNDSGNIVIWIDRNKIVSESNKRLFG